MDFTKEQEEAINTKTTNIIVSAGAGSGKTAVLTKRIETLLSNGIDISNLLVLTFTKKAAGQMKEKIKTALVTNPNLTNQAKKVETSYITTFDSFTSSILKKYHYAINIDKNFDIPADGIIEIKLYELIDEIFEEYYNSNNNVFNNFITKYVLKSDKKLKNDIIKIYKKLESLPNIEEYINTYITTFYDINNLKKYVNLYEEYLLTKISYIEEELDNLKDNIDYYNDTIIKLTPLLEANDYNDIKNSLASIKLKNSPKGSSEEFIEAKTIISNIIKELNNLCIYDNISDIIRYLNNTKEETSIIIDIIKQLLTKLELFKTSNNYLTFTDITMKVIKILEENIDIRNELKSSFSEILIDEYQDTNNITQKLIDLISNDNVYVVGDVKQSIYKFRDANPKLFQDKYDLYSNSDKGIKIDLTNNFRSRKEVVDSLNDMFSYIMDNQIGGANYRLDHIMNAGNTTYQTKEDNYNLEIYNYDNKEYKEYSNYEKEIFIIGKDIKEKIQNNYQVTDKEGLRNITYSDICIILESSTSFDTYKKIFEYLGIPLEIIKDKNIATENLMAIIRNYINLILKVKENKLDTSFKHSYISLCRSFIYHKLDNEIYDIFKNNSFINSDLYILIKDIINQKDYSVNYIIKSFIDKFKIYDKLVYNGNIEDNESILEFIYNASTNFDKNSKNLEDFYNYLVGIKEYDIKLNSKMSLVSNNCVTLMTIHKSKGLEYPLCYIGNTNVKFNIKELSETFIFSNTYGIVIPFYDKVFMPNILLELVKNLELKEIISEKIRLFYVALSRAKEKNIIITSITNDTPTILSSGKVSNKIKLEYKSFSSMLKSIYPVISNSITPINLDEVGLTNNYKKNILIEENSLLLDNSYKIDFKTNNIESNLITKQHASHIINTLYEENTQFNINLGNSLHQLLERTDFSVETNNVYINNLMNMPFMQDINSKQVIKEFEFIDGNLTGIIDLLLVSDNLIEIIDYKLNDISKEYYVKQVLTYINYIKKLYPNKEVIGYLYSITTSNYKQITN